MQRRTVPPVPVAPIILPMFGQKIEGYQLKGYLGE